VKVQWWVLMKKGTNLDEQHLYDDCWNGKWKCNFVILEQWLNISFVLFLFQAWKIISNKNQITILIACASRVEVNFDVKLMHLAMCERCYRHGRNCVFDFLKPFISLNWFQWSLINLFMVQNYLCIFLDINDQ
jgi:hypothetical protein